MHEIVFAAVVTSLGATLLTGTWKLCKWIVPDDYPSAEWAPKDVFDLVAEELFNEWWGTQASLPADDADPRFLMLMSTEEGF